MLYEIKCSGYEGESIISMLQQVYKSLPDDKPITAISIVEDASKCPPGFYVVTRTHDQDSDADLWKESNFFGRKVTRYLCLSKTEGIADYIVEAVGIIMEKETPPDGYCLVQRTIDSEQKAWRKRQLCYRLSRRNVACSAVTDIIVLNRAKKAPEGFSLAGDINGMALCFKTGILVPTTPPSVTAPLLSYSPSPNNVSNNKELRPAPTPPNGMAYPRLSPTHDYENLVRPIRPAPPRPLPSHSAYATIASYHGLEGIPFILNPKLDGSSSVNSPGYPAVKVKTKYQLDKEYEYDFRLEKQT